MKLLSRFGEMPLLDTDIAKGLLAYGQSHKLMVGAVALGAGALWYCYRPRNMPPGPWGYPVIGSTIDMEQNSFEELERLGKKYGDVFTIWHGGNNYTVVLNSFEVVKEAFLKRGSIFNNRNLEWLSEFMGIEDEIINANYTQRYIASRKFALNAIRNSGAHDGRWNEVFGTELDELSVILADKHGQPVSLQPLLRNCAANIICKLLIGTRYPLEDKELQWLIGFLDKTFNLIFTAFSTKKHFFPYSSYLRWKITGVLRKNCSELVEYMEKKIDTHMETFDPNHIRDIIDLYIQHGELDKIGKRRMAGTVLNLLPDGVHTVSSIQVWMFVFLIKHPEWQGKIFAEINNIKGSGGGHIEIKERMNFPVTRAFINEVLRILSPVFTNTPAQPTENTTFRGYNIPVQTTIRINYYGIQHDAKLFPDPDEFKPERFLGKDESQVEGFMPFGIGRRSCLGEQIGKNEVFFFTVNLVRKFTLELAPGEELPCFENPFSRRTRLPTEFKAICKERTL